jgi:type IV/VI secretion system ImpK/VasF family protein
MRLPDVFYDLKFRHWLHHCHALRCRSSLDNDNDGLLWISELEEKTQGLVKLFEQATGLVDKHRYVEFALVAHLDESVLSVQDALCESWASLPWQVKRFGQFTAGEVFFERLIDLQKDTTAPKEYLALYWILMRYGFDGKYALRPAIEKENLMVETQQFLCEYFKSLQVEGVSNFHTQVQPPNLWHRFAEKLLGSKGSHQSK